ncbi:MAG: methyltransferase [Deltaproteobacteria bacterium]|nr:methyltransferase [Candidatus Anaeroferrophillus wilburensis]MBN2889486.1 methyltransferase [Deltaproteobacteria bacterium]
MPTTPSGQSTVTTEVLPAEQLSIQQPKSGYRYNMDPFLLADAVTLETGTNVLDLGTGVGVIPLLLARRFPSAGPFTGIEIQPELANLAQNNTILNKLQNRITIHHGDYRFSQNIAPPASFATVITNPPYYQKQQGRLNQCRQKAIARHEITTDLTSLATTSAYFLKPNGRIFVIYPAERLSSLLAAFTKQKLIPKQLQCIHPRPDEPAELVILTARKNGREGLEIAAPRVIQS